MKSLKIKNILEECSYKTARSSGAGGQHINKVETKVTLIFNVQTSAFLSEEEKLLVLEKLKNKINKANELLVSAQVFKSQMKNKRKAEEKLIALLQQALKKQKQRKKTKISEATKAKRLKVKRLKAAIKKNRQKPPF